MLNQMVRASLISLVLLAGWGLSHAEVPAPAPQPGPGPTVPPKPSDPVPAPPLPNPLPYKQDATGQAFPSLVADAPPRQSETISGTLLKMDLTTKEGRLATDLGREVIFHIPKPELFVHLSVGQRVTIKLDGGQRVVGVMETTTPELQAPHPTH